MPIQRIDVHYHVLPPEMFAVESPTSTMMRNAPGVIWEAARASDVLEKDGVSTAMLSFPGNTHLSVERDARQGARRCNEYYARLRQDYKGRFGIFAAVPPLDDVDGVLAEVAYALDTLHAEGIRVLTSYNAQKWLGDPSFAPVWDELNRRSAVVFVHPDSVCTCAAPPHISLELPFDTARTAYSLWHAGAFERWPNIRFIFSHGGGPVPMLIARYNGLGRPGPDGTTLRDAHVHLGRQWYDTAQAASESSMRGVLALADHSRILFGSDAPFAPSANLQASALDSAIKDQRLLRAIEYDNAVAIMPSLKRAG